MGGKRKRQRQYLLLFTATGIVFLAMTLSGCQTTLKQTSCSVQSEPSVDPRPQVADDTKAEEPWTEAETAEFNSLDQAETLLLKGEYHEALDSLSQVVSPGDNHGKRFSDRALHILVTALAHSEGPMNDDSQAIPCFTQLESLMPDSVYGPASPYWLTVMNEVMVQKNELQTMKKTIRSQYNKIRALELQIEQLKAVDLELGTPKAGENSHE